MIVLSLQSQVVYGHVGHQAGDFILQSLGHEVWSLPTALYSNHLGKKSAQGGVLSARRLADLLKGIEALGRLGHIDAVHTGYIGSPAIARLAARVIRKVKAGNPRAIYLCDPVMGDEGALYVAPSIAVAIRRFLLPLADIATPNATELFHLADLAVKAGPERALRSLWRSLERRPILVATGLRPRRGGRRQAKRIAAYALTETGLDRVEEDFFPALAVSGLGDAFAAFFLGYYLKNRDSGSALRRAMRGMEILCRSTLQKGRDELDLIGSQSRWRASGD